VGLPRAGGSGGVISWEHAPLPCTGVVLAEEAACHGPGPCGPPSRSRSRNVRRPHLMHGTGAGSVTHRPSAHPHSAPRPFVTQGFKRSTVIKPEPCGNRAVIDLRIVVGASRGNGELEIVEDPSRMSLAGADELLQNAAAGGPCANAPGGHELAGRPSVASPRAAGAPQGEPRTTRPARESNWEWGFGVQWAASNG
jgi:hypothetical protein